MATEKTAKEKTGIYTKDSYEVTLPLSSEKQDDVVVIINGFATQIQRGVPVEVSAEVYEVLKNSEKMDNLALMRSRKLSQGV